MPGEMNVPLRDVILAGRIPPNKVKELLAKPDFPKRRDFWGEWFTTAETYKYFINNPYKPESLKGYNRKFSDLVWLMKWDDETAKKVEDSDVVKIIGGEKMVHWRDFQGYLDSRPPKTTYNHPRYSDDI